MTSIGTTFSDTATRVLLCGSGELGKEVVIELQRLGAEVIACDRYENAPAMQVADRSYAFSMLDGEALRRSFRRKSQTLSCLKLKPLPLKHFWSLSQRALQ